MRRKIGNLKITMSWFMLFMMLIIISFSFQSCEGCSRSGLRNHAAKNSESKSNYSRSDANKTTSRKSTLEEVHPKKILSGSSLTTLFKQCNSAVFLVYTSDGEQGLQGSGFFISSSGIGISNYHVFKGTTKGLEVIKLVSGEQLKIDDILAQSEDDDYIIFRVRTNKNLNYLNVATALPEIGEDVFAIGNPQGLEHTLSTGIISGYRGEYKELIQTTAEITHGSSGGPLLNMRGEVIGITTSGLGEANLNFAVNINTLPIDRVVKKK